uniref:Uncharacterized protein n=1 Tax=Lutzomyia longipalpis TaxID=7200 RepID=A0A7G3B3M4_LUTLO
MITISPQFSNTRALLCLCINIHEMNLPRGSSSHQIVLPMKLKPMEFGDICNFQITLKLNLHPIPVEGAENSYTTPDHNTELIDPLVICHCPAKSGDYVILNGHFEISVGPNDTPTVTTLNEFLRHIQD